MHAGKDFFGMELIKFNDCLDYFSNKSIFFTSNTLDADIKFVVDNIEYCRKRFKTSFVLVDHLHHFVHNSSDDRVTEIENFMKEIKKVAIRTGVHIFLIAHPHSLKKNNDKVTMNDIKGASAIKQDSDNVISIWRDKNSDDNILNASFQKIRYDQGKEGIIDFLFDKPSQFYQQLN